VAKTPKNLPERGDRCKLRGRDGYGVLQKYDPESEWATVNWDAGKWPKMVHRYELQKTD